MRKSTGWVATMALLAAMPTVGLAGPFDFFRGSKDQASKNQETAEQIAEAMKAAQLQGRDVEIEFKDGTAVLTGIIADATQKAKATQAASHVPGVDAVDNRMRVANAAAPTPVGRIVQTAGQQGPANAVQTADATSQDPWATTAPRSRPRQSVFAETPAQPTAPKPVIRQTAVRPDDVPQRIPAQASRTNQEIAQSIADAISNADVRGRRIRIRVQNGTAELGGEVASRGEWDTITRIAGTVPGVQRVNNKMTVGMDASAETFDPRMAAMPPQGVDPRFAYRQAGAIQPIVPVGYQQAPPAPGGDNFVPPGQDAPAPLPGYGHPGAGSPYQAYSMPNVPEYAWPSYAAYPNSAQISYPQQYSASAWPYIGPFYPYPQVPLGWREAQLEWDDGYWHLNFRPRTSKWFWFVNPKNW